MKRFTEIIERIESTVTITEVLSDGSFHATLPNGKVILLYRRRQSPTREMSVGDQAVTSLSVQDFSCGEWVR
jgi:hypothetical protein